jgi:CheY-like chemotaxis protein
MPSSQRELWEAPKRKVLLLDDDLDDVVFFEMAMSRCTQGVEVVHAIDGAEGLKLLKPDRGFLPSLIITDLKMPGVDGFEFLLRLKDHPDRSKMRVIVFSSSDLTIDRERAKALNINGYHVKPVGFAPLIEEVRRMYDLYLRQPAKQVLANPTVVPPSKLLLGDKH